VVEDPVLGAPEPGDRPPPTYRRRSRDVSIARMSHRPRRLGAPIAAAVAVIVLVTGLAIAGAHSRPPHSTSTSTTTRKGHKSVTPPTSTTTTAPATFAPSSTSGSDVTYTLPFSSYTVTFNATTGACYIQITDSTGSTPYAAVLNQGQTKQIVLTGTSKVQLGAPSHIAVQVDRTPVTLPTPLPATLNITFAGAAPSATSTT
jgi:archaellum component FlaF (FlaF/FlaG flagellin family)